MAKDWALEGADHDMVRVPIGAIRPHPDNPNEGDVAAISESIDENDWYGTITVQKSTGRILAGEHRWRAAKKRKMTEVAVYIRDVDDVAAMRIMLVDNETAKRGRYNPDKMRAALEMVAEVDDTLRGTGFDLDYLQELEEAREAAEELEAAAAAGPETGPMPQVDDAGIDTQYGVIVLVGSEAEQEAAFEALAEEYGADRLRAVSV